ncbi:uncharacterized protein LOC131230218 isoform X2 [Magnolia sinica]|uniref:uncharacterized protein LOC131230218 isoform X2 n=1 Tax=Magnolia sinica TaxID=86752 RepID=UPI00265B2C15|nr:uncharacterized protein LOC131230218 isoform X2 [Magnolia sinica]
MMSRRSAGHLFDIIPRRLCLFFCLVRSRSGKREMANAVVGFPSQNSFPPSNPSHPSGTEDPSHPEKLKLPSYKWRLVIAYDGTNFSGWQYQESTPTIQCIITKALMRITKLERHELCLAGASRTDSGVHAWGQVAHFLTPFSYDSLDSLHAALGGLLPSEIRVREISPARPEFHARFSTESKIYHYKIYNGPIMDPFQCRYAYHSTYNLNAAAMKEAAKHFVGKHDFSAFANATTDDRPRDPIKDISRFDVVELGAVLQLEVEGSGFLYKQVRNMVGLLIQIGREALPPYIVPDMIATRDRRELAKFTLTAPPHGLCLMSVKYNQEILQPPLGSLPISYGRHHSVSKCKLPFY